jgi:hypothetical protein
MHADKREEKSGDESGRPDRPLQTISRRQRLDRGGGKHLQWDFVLGVDRLQR